MPLWSSLVLMTITWHQDQLCVFVALFPVFVPGFINSLWIISAVFWEWYAVHLLMPLLFMLHILSDDMAWHQECLHSGKRQSALVCNDTAILETCLHVMCSNVCACVRWMLKCWYLCCICAFEYLLKHSVEPTQSSLFHFKAHFLYWG